MLSAGCLRVLAERCQVSHGPAPAPPRASLQPAPPRLGLPRSPPCTAGSSRGCGGGPAPSPCLLFISSLSLRHFSLSPSYRIPRVGLSLLHLIEVDPCKQICTLLRWCQLSTTSHSCDDISRAQPQISALTFSAERSGLKMAQEKERAGSQN